MIRRLWRRLFDESRDPHERQHNGGESYQGHRVTHREIVTDEEMVNIRKWLQHSKETDHDADVCGCGVFGK